MSKIESRVRGEAIKATFPDGQEVLYVQLHIDCPECGQHTVRFAGHHLRVLRNLFIEFIDLHPELCGDESSIQTTEKFADESGGATGDPTLN